MEQVDVAIIGSGPAGIAAALSLQKLAPAQASRTIVLEKEKHPREKLCGGGVTALAESIMDWLDVSWEQFDKVPQVPIRTARLRFEGKDVVARFPRKKCLFRVFRRSDYDARFVEIARERGVEIREETPLTGLERAPDGVILSTPSGQIHAKVVVGADGAKSVVRRWMGLGRNPGPPPVSRLMEVLTPEIAERTPEFRDETAVFDFSRVPDGVQGYLWDFPSYVDGKAMMNRGVFDSRVLHERPQAQLVPMLDDYLAHHERSLSECELKGHPERYYDPEGIYSVPHILLIGDAAGIEPMLGEGISWAMKYGPFMAEEVRNAFATGDFSFSGYSRRLAASQLGQGLAKRVKFAKFVYARDRRFFRIAWPILQPLTIVIHKMVETITARAG